MKKHFKLVLATLVLGLCSPALAQNFSTGSDYMSTGSSLSSTVYGVGADYVDPMASMAGAPAHRGRMSGNGSDWDDTEVDPGNPMPIGEPYILLAFAAMAAGVVALRRWKMEDGRWKMEDRNKKGVQK